MSEAIKRRLNDLRNKMRDAGYDAVLITERKNYIYLSGFTGTSAVLLISGDRAVLLTDFRYTEQAAAQAPDFEVIQYTGSQYAELNRLLENSGIHRLAFEDAYISYSQHSEYLKELKVREFVPLGRMIEELRLIKDDEEIEIIKAAVRVADDVFLHILDYIKPGITETELAAEMEHHMRRLGATGPSFETIVASGRRASMPHGVASEKRIEAGDVVTLDFGAIYGEYCSDITRTVFVGKPDKELEKIYRIVLEANRLGLEAVKSGVSGKEADSIARNYIADAGYGDNFGHGLGHGVGLDIHEEPRLSPRGDAILRDGMVVTVEPGIYIPGLGGVRIEDMVVVRGGSATVLTSSSKEMIIL